MNGLLAIISTAGVSLNAPCYTIEYKYASRVLSGEIEDDEYFTDICEADENDDIGSIDTWRKSNPVRCSFEKGVEDIQSAYRKAKESEQELNMFTTKVCNKWLEARINSYMNIKKFERQMIENIPFDLKGRDCYIGFDLSAKNDLTSVVFMFPYQTDEKDDFGNKIVQYYSYHHSFIANEENMKRKIRQDHFPYDLALRNGFLSLTNSEIVDQSKVLQWVLNELERIEVDPFENATFVFDPANASKSIMDLQTYIKEGLMAKGKSMKKAQELAETKVVECYQSYQSLNEATNGYREQIYMGKAFWVNDPLMKFAMVNAVIKQNDGKIKIDKDANTHRIDPVDALLCAFKLALYHIFKNKNNVKKYYDVFLED